LSTKLSQNYHKQIDIYTGFFTVARLMYNVVSLALTKLYHKQDLCMAKGFIIAGERSGVGKTTITLAIVKTLINRNLNVQCFKVGPDFIDPGYHAAVTGRASRNLDGWMMGRDYCVNSFANNCRSADIAVVEGVMGLFDGYDGSSEAGSTAQMAKWLNLPVILIIDGSSLARSGGAVALGFESYDPELEMAGIIFNRVAGENHFQYLCDGVKARCKAEVLGYIQRNSEWLIAERHLGLIMAAESRNLQQRIDAMALQLQQTVNIDKIIARAKPIIHDAQQSKQKNRKTGSVAIGVARDAAFCFYYQDNLEYFEKFGAKLVFFSPIHDTSLPPGISGLYLPGGYPELYASDLSRNERMRAEVLEFCKKGKPVYAECGGFLYLLENLVDQNGNSHDMAGLFRSKARMIPHLQRLGYVEVEVQKGCPFLKQGERFRGHEFHYSEITEMPKSIARCYQVSGRKSRPMFSEGYIIHNTVASYIHMHFASNPSFAEGFVEACRAQMHHPGQA
jgi:cobyrinic acid a,c-diamide synthase